jgi:hypothetical protein
MSFQNKINKNKFNKKDIKHKHYRGINQELIKYIYTTLDISQFKYEILKYEDQLNKFTSDVYHIAPNFNGKNSFLVFNKINSRYYSFLVDRKQLSYNYEKIDIDNVFIHHCNVDIDLSLYNGTIFDGIYIKKGDIHEYIITDVYYFKGTDYTSNKLTHKLFEVKLYLDNIGVQIRCNQNKINNRTNLTLTVNEICDIKDIRNYVNTYTKKYNNKYQMRGLCFYPDISGIKLIHLFSNTNNNTTNINKILVHDTQSDNSSSNKNNNYKTSNLKRSNRLVKKVFIAKNNAPVYTILEMKATSIVDNYKMYAVEKVQNGGITKLRKYQMDIAYISSIKKSEWVRDIINDSPKGSVFVKCIWRDDKHKWEPLELVKNVRLPSLMDDILEKIHVMEESDSDSE